MKLVSSFFILSVGLLLSHVGVAADAAIWLDLQVSNEKQSLVFQFPPIEASHSGGKLELKSVPVVSARSQEGSYLLVPASSLLGEKGGGVWAFSGSFDVLQSVEIDQGMDGGCKSLSLVLAGNKVQAVDGSERCGLGAQGWQLQARYWRSASKVVVERGKEKSSWWDVKPASDKAKKRMKKI